jgi:hypothetical protein
MKTQCYTINKLSELTGIDRRTLKKRLDDVEPAKVEAGRKYYTLEDATEDRKGLAALCPPFHAKHTGHYLEPSLRKFYTASHLMMQALFEYEKFCGRCRDDREFLKLIIDDFNRPTDLGGEPVASVLLGACEGMTETCEVMSGIYTLCDEIGQRFFHVDAALNVTGFFSSPEGMRMRAEAKQRLGRSEPDDDPQ